MAAVERNPNVTEFVARRAKLLLLGLAGLAALAAALLLVLWFVVRVEVDADEVLILVRKTGDSVPADLGEVYRDQVVLYPALVEALAAKRGVELPAPAGDDGQARTEALARVARGYQGIVYEVLKEGRYFPNPYTYERVKRPVTVVEQGEVGVLIRRFGKPLPAAQTIARAPDERGPVAEILQPGRHYINTLAYDVQKFPAVQIPEGHCGVVTLLSGEEPRARNTYTVEPGEKGVQHATLAPGLEYVNPYEKKIDIVDIRNRTLHMRGDDVIYFPSNDSFTIEIAGTIEWSINSRRVAEVAVKYGDEKDIIDKIILPYTRSISRIEGSKLQARDFISGKSRTEFQQKLHDELKAACGEQGITIHSALVREILPPAEIAALISQREQADQEIERSRNQIEEAQAEARLVEQREMQARNADLGDARRQTVSLTKEAEQRKVIAVTEASRQFEVAKLDLEAATKQAAAQVARAQAEANVVLFGYQARAEPQASAVRAFGDGMIYAQHFFLQKVAPSIQSILTDTNGPFADIFRTFQNIAPPPASAAPVASVAQKGGQP